MDRAGFGEFLKTRKLGSEQIEAATALAERFEAFIATSGRPDAHTTWAFCKTLIAEGQNTYDNFVTLARYGRFIHNNDIYVAILELVDGAEAQPNLYKRVGECFGEALRDEIFDGIGVAPMGTSSNEKPRYLFPVIDRLVEKVGEPKSAQLLSASLRDLPDEYYRHEKRKFKKAGSVDAYLKVRHGSLVRQLQKCKREGQLFFSQEVTDEVIDYVKQRPETESGVRQGNTIYVTKIPYNTARYIAESDPTMKRYYACHCPWAREAVKNGDVRLNAVFCNCSGGYSKRPWEVIFGQKLQVEVLESALKGDFRCRFAVKLPEETKAK